MTAALIKTFFKGLGRNISAHAPEILMGMGTAGSVTAVILAVRATMKAEPARQEAVAEKTCRRDEEKSGNSLDIQDVARAIRTGWTKPEKLCFTEWLKACWKFYIPPLGMELFSLMCFWSAHGISHHRQMVLAGLYSGAMETINNYQAAFEEHIGKKEADKVRDEEVQKRVDRLPPPPVGENPAETWRWCLIDNVYFQSTYPKIKDAQNELNHRMIQEMYASKADLYWLLDPYKQWLKPTGTDGELGWSVDRLLELDVREADGPNHEPVYAITYRDKDGLLYPPEAGFWKLY